jgi:hypothetical protein
MTLETESKNGPEGWRVFLKNHWKMFLLLAVGAVLALVGAILVFLWFIGNAQSTGMVPSTLGLWTMGNLVTFLLNLIFWEALLIGVPVILAVIAIWLWLKKLLCEQNEEYRFFNNRSRGSSGGNVH